MPLLLTNKPGFDNVQIELLLARKRSQSVKGSVKGEESCHFRDHSCHSRASGNPDYPLIVSVPTVRVNRLNGAEKPFDKQNLSQLEYNYILDKLESKVKGVRKMLKILEDKFEIKKANEQFLTKFQELNPIKVQTKLGYRGGMISCKVLWIEKCGIWVFATQIAGSRYWNAFGLVDPTAGSMVSITCEVNFPLKGIDRRIGGAFAKDNLGSLYVLHRGRIGGGRTGIGKTLFTEHYQGEMIDVQDGDRVITLAKVGELEYSEFVEQVSKFVTEVDRIKALVS